MSLLTTSVAGKAIPKSGSRKGKRRVREREKEKGGGGSAVDY